MTRSKAAKPAIYFSVVFILILISLQGRATDLPEKARNRIDYLAASLKKYVPEVEPPVGEVTLHQLLTHSSGLPEYRGDDFGPVSRDEFIDIYLSLPLVFEPGTDVAYSNVGYGAIAAVIEFVTERDFEAYLEDEVLWLNGLKATGHLFPENLDADFAHGYLEDNDMGNIAGQIEVLEGDCWNLIGSGGMQASTQNRFKMIFVLAGMLSVPMPRLEQ